MNTNNSNKEKLYIIIPAYNEEANIESVVFQWHTLCDALAKGGVNPTLVIIDDGSKDETLFTLKNLQPQYKYLDVIHKENSGHGATVLYGYKYALKCKADYVFQTDSDGQTDPNEFHEMWEKRYLYNFQCGYRLGRQDGISRKIVTRVLKIVVLFRFHKWVKDANTPFRLMDAASLAEKIKLIPDDYNLSNVILAVLYEKDKNMKKRYITITFKPRQGGVNSINLPRIFKIGKDAFRDFLNIEHKIEGK